MSPRALLATLKDWRRWNGDVVVTGVATACLVFTAWTIGMHGGIPQWP